MHKYVIISILKNDYITNFNKSEWPLHITIIRPFYTLKSSEVLLDILKNICSTKKAINTTGKSYEMFGNDNVPVTELYKPTELQDLHDEIMYRCGEWMKFKTLEYGVYRPHVANQANLKIDLGESVHIENVSLIEIEGRDRKVLGTVDLQ